MDEIFTEENHKFLSQCFHLCCGCIKRAQFVNHVNHVAVNKGSFGSGNSLIYFSLYPAT